MSCQKFQLSSRLMGTGGKSDQFKGKFSTDLMALQSLSRNFSSGGYFKMGLIFTKFSFCNFGHIPTCSPAFFLFNYLKNQHFFLNLKMECNFLLSIIQSVTSSTKNMHIYSFAIFKHIIGLFEPMLLAGQATNTIIQILQAFLWNKISK